MSKHQFRLFALTGWVAFVAGGDRSRRRRLEETEAAELNRVGKCQGLEKFGSDCLIFLLHSSRNGQFDYRERVLLQNIFKKKPN